MISFSSVLDSSIGFFQHYAMIRSSTLVTMIHERSEAGTHLRGRAAEGIVAAPAQRRGETQAVVQAAGRWLQAKAPAAPAGSGVAWPGVRGTATA